MATLPLKAFHGDEIPLDGASEHPRSPGPSYGSPVSAAAQTNRIVKHRLTLPVG